MKYIMFEHAGSGNHGCEAIVRTTRKMLGDADCFLQTLNADEDYQYGLDRLTDLITLPSRQVHRDSVRGLIMRLQSRLNPNFDYEQRESCYRNKELLLRNAIALSIGGDNYCYAGIIDSMRDKLNAFSAKKIPTVLWGCSVDRPYLNEYTIRDLKKYSLITARESLTTDVLADIGIQDTVVQCSDPAFTLERESVSWNSKILNAGNVIGINVSDFMRYYNAYPDATYRNFYNLLKHILETTDCEVALIPHVCQLGNDDLVPLQQLHKELNSNRVFCVSEQYNCMQLKDIIARCRLFVGCRTHATIAAYSSNVPTLVVGYSIKAKGICRDLFGKESGLLVDVREFTSDQDLSKLFDQFLEQEQELRNHLIKTMPEYRKRAYLAKDALIKLSKINR